MWGNDGYVFMSFAKATCVASSRFPCPSFYKHEFPTTVEQYNRFYHVKIKFNFNIVIRCD